MTISPLSYRDAYGYHSWNQFKQLFYPVLEDNARIDHLTPDSYNESIQSFNYIKSAMQIAGYTPIIGTIVGISKLIFLAYHRHEIQQDAVRYSSDGYGDRLISCIHGLTVRSAIEATSFGFLLIIPDLIFSFSRNSN